MTRPPRSTLILASAVMVAAAGTGYVSTRDSEGAFEVGATPTVDCLAHQPHRPGRDFTDGRPPDTAKVMAILRYYTANGRKPYCDRKPPTEEDLAWATLYVRLGADRTHVTAILGTS